MFSITTDLMSHQSAAVAKLAPPRVGALFMEMGTGKSLTALELARLRQERWDRLFWFCPCALRQTVLEQVLEHTDIPRDKIAVWDDQGIKTAEDDILVHIIGIETMSSSDRAVLLYARLVTDDSYVIVDESTYIKGNRAKRTQRITRMSERSRYRTILTGTPLTQSITDIYSQMMFLSPKVLGYRSWYSFAANHIEYEMKPSDFNPKHKIKTGRILRTFNREDIAEKIEPYVYQVTKEECLEIPAKQFIARKCHLTDEQSTAYEDAKHLALTELNPDDWGDSYILRLFTDLQKIVCGFEGSPKSGFSRLDNDRIPLLLETIAEIPPGEKVIIWAKYLEAARMIETALVNAFDKSEVAVFTGDIHERQRNANLERWRRSSRFLVATQSIGGHGLTLNESAYTIFYADSFKYAERLQAEDRNHRIGQERHSTYITLHCENTIDDRIAAALKMKGNTLEAFRTMVEGFKKKGARDQLVEFVKNL